MSACCRVVHLDLKSCNVLIAGDGTAKISDVGLALLIRDRYLSSTAPAGTFSWVAPEVILGGGSPFSSPLSWGLHQRMHIACPCHHCPVLRDVCLWARPLVPFLPMPRRYAAAQSRL